MRFLNKREVESKLRENLNLKSGFSNSLYNRRNKGNAMDLIDRINTWIIKYGDLLFEDELKMIK
jgi:hypothetical protein